MGDDPAPASPASIQALRQRLGLSQGAFADRLGVSRTTVLRWEQGRLRPRPEIWKRFEAIDDERAERDRESAIPAAEPQSTSAQLPVSLTSFIGRERERRLIAELLNASRLVTLTGAGGSGKTRLAIEVAREGTGGRRRGTGDRVFASTQSAVATPAAGGDVWFVDFAPLADADLVASAVATTLGVREEPSRPLLESIAQFLAPRASLLLLDNCEHLLDACARLASTLLSACPGLRLLATSREPLGLSGEQLFRVDPLSLPERGGLRSAPSHCEEATGGATLAHSSVLGPQSSLESSVLNSDAGRLFVERVRLVEPGFAVTAESAASVAGICERLDGLPLALELAAARVRVLSVEQIAQHLGDRFRLLVGGSRDAPARHETLRAAIDWSYDLLDGEEQALFRRLSVFAGSFGLDAAETVGMTPASGRSAADAPGPTEASHVERPESSSVLELLQRLVDQSLIVKADVAGEARYRLLETLRTYGRDQLLERDDAPSTLAAHAAYYLELAERAERELNGSAAQCWLERLDRELDNLRAALAWCSSSEGDSVTGLRIAASLWRYWYYRGYLSEGRRWLGLIDRRRGRLPPSLRAKALDRAGHLASEQGDFSDARVLFAESIALNREIGDPGGLAAVLHHLALLEYERRDYAATRSLTEEALALYRTIGDHPSVASQLANLGLLALFEGDYDRARAIYEESLAIFHELGNETMIALCLGNLGAVAHAKGQNEPARDLYERSLEVLRRLRSNAYIPTILDRLGNIARRLGDFGRAQELLVEGLTLRQVLGAKNGIAESLESLAVLASAVCDWQRAAIQFGAAQAVLGQIGGSPLPFYLEDRQRALRATRSALGDERFLDLERQGHALADAALIELARAPFATRGDTRRLPAAASGDREPRGGLSAREQEILGLLAGGQSNKEISQQLGISVRTVERHISNLYAKIGARGKADAIAYALRTVSRES